MSEYHSCPSIAQAGANKIVADLRDFLSKTLKDRSRISLTTMVDTEVAVAVVFEPEFLPPYSSNPSETAIRSWPKYVATNLQSQAFLGSMPIHF